MGWLAVELTEIVWAFTDATNPSIAPVKSDHPVLIIDNSQSELRTQNDKRRRMPRNTAETFEGLYMCFFLQGGPEIFSKISPLSCNPASHCLNELLWYRFPKTSDKPRVRHMITMPCVIWGAGTEKEGINQLVEWRIMIRIFSLSSSEWSSCRKHILSHLGFRRPWRRTMWTSRAE